jgi:hypothetical protein
MPPAGFPAACLVVDHHKLSAKLTGQGDGLSVSGVEVESRLG